MKTRNKIIWGLILLIIVSIGGGVYYLISNLDAIVKAAIEKYGSEATQTAVRVQQVKIKLGEGSGSIRGLTVANPADFSTPNAFSLADITTRINVKALTDQQIVIDEIRILGPQVFYEMNAAKQGNLNVIQANLSKGAPAKPAKADQPSGKSPITLTIRKLVMSDATLQALLVPLNNKHYDLKLPVIQMQNLHGTPEDITRQILDQLIDNAKVAIKNSAFGQELEKLKVEAREKVAEKKAEIKAKADEKLEAEKQKVGDKLKNLLNR